LYSFDALAIRVDRLLPRRAIRASLLISEHVRMRLHEALVRAAADHMRHQDVGDRELVRRNELAICEPAVELLEAHLSPVPERLARLGAFADNHVDEPARQEWS